MTESVYRITTKFDARCKRCSLSTGCAIGGHGFRPVAKLQLLIISAYPGNEEIKQGFSLAPNPVSEAMDVMNAGRFLRSALIHIFDKDPNFPDELKPFYQFCGYTNIIKCSPIIRKDKKEVTANHINTCKDWTQLEIEEIAKQNPGLPLLLAGSEACKLLGKNMSVYSNRRKTFYYREVHPVVVTFNPIEPARYMHRTIKKSKTRLDGTIKVEDLGYLKGSSGPIVGSVSWHFMRDLELIKKVVVENYYNRLHWLANK